METGQLETVRQRESETRQGEDGEREGERWRARHRQGDGEVT